MVADDKLVGSGTPLFPIRVFNRSGYAPSTVAHETADMRRAPNAFCAMSARSRDRFRRHRICCHSEPSGKRSWSFISNPSLQQSTQGFMHEDHLNPWPRLATQIPSSTSASSTTTASPCMRHLKACDALQRTGLEAERACPCPTAFYPAQAPNRFLR